MISDLKQALDVFRVSTPGNFDDLAVTFLSNSLPAVPNPEGFKYIMLYNPYRYEPCFSFSLQVKMWS